MRRRRRRPQRVESAGGHCRPVGRRDLRLSRHGDLRRAVFVPPAGTENVLNYEVNLIGQAAIVLGVGGALYWFSRRNSPS